MESYRNVFSKKGGIFVTISKSNFIVISVVLAAVLFLFQFSNISAQYTSQATKNKNAEPSIQIQADSTLLANKLENKTDYSTAIIQNEIFSESIIIKEWCTYTKRSYRVFQDLESFYEDLSRSCKLLILNGKNVTEQKEIDTLVSIAERGIHIIFTALPNTAVIESSTDLCTLLGIEYTKDASFRTNGMILYEGFLLGGEKTYKHLKKTIPYFHLQTGTKKYMVGTIKDQKKKKIKNEDLPPVIWRNAYKNSFVFAINSDLCTDHTLLGFLTAMWSETSSYYMYPVINAQSVVFDNFPYLANENKRAIQKQYYYKPRSLFTDVIWPDVTSILNATKDTFTGMIAPQLEYKKNADPISKDTIDYYFKQTERISGELGLSGSMLAKKDTDFEQKIQKDTQLMEQYVPDYKYTIFAPGNMPENVYNNYIGDSSKESVLSTIHTLVMPKEKTDNLVHFYNNDILSLSNTIDGFSHTDKQDLYMRSIETALGYSCINVDMQRVLYPTSDKDDWTKLSKKLSSYLNTYWAVYRNAFDQTDISHTDIRTRQFLSVNYKVYRYNDTINLSVTNLHGSASFVLNLSNEKITAITGGTFQKIEHNRYRITVADPDVIIDVSSDTDWRDK